MDPVSDNKIVIEALAKASAAEAIANKALQIAIDCLAELRAIKHTPPSLPAGFIPDPFSETPDSPPVIPNSTVAPRRASPFSVSFVSPGAARASVAKSNENLEKSLSDEEAIKNELWDESVGN